MRRRSASYRQRGPDRRSLLARGLDDVSAAVQHQIRSRQSVRMAAAAAVPVLVGLTAARKRIGLHPAATLTLGCGVPLGAAIVLPSGRARYAASAAAYMYPFKVSWELPYDDPQRLRGRLLTDAPIRFDTFAGGGVPPGLRLQRALRTPGRVTAFDKAVTSCTARGSCRTCCSATCSSATSTTCRAPADACRPPTTSRRRSTGCGRRRPPWWTSEKEGRMGGELERVARLVVCDVLRRPPPDDDSVGGNPWGSMPSDHVSSAAITARGLSELGVFYGALGWTYVAAASFAVVYLGEHYVADVVVGLLIAEVVHHGEPLAAPLVRAVAHAVAWRPGGRLPERRDERRRGPAGPRRTAKLLGRR